MVTYDPKNKTTDYSFLSDNISQGSNPVPIAGGAKAGMRPMDWNSFLANMFQATTLDPSKQGKGSGGQPAPQLGGILAGLLGNFGMQAPGTAGLFSLLRGELK